MSSQSHIYPKFRWIDNLSSKENSARKNFFALLKQMFILLFVSVWKYQRKYNIQSFRPSLEQFIQRDLHCTPYLHTWSTVRSAKCFKPIHPVVHFKFQMDRTQVLEIKVKQQLEITSKQTARIIHPSNALQTTHSHTLLIIQQVEHGVIVSYRGCKLKCGRSSQNFCGAFFYPLECTRWFPIQNNMLTIDRRGWN